MAKISIQGATVEDLCLDFTLPGYSEVLLKPNGNNVSVTIYNLEEYLDSIIDMTLYSGVKPQIDAMRQGFHSVIDTSHFKCFSGNELSMIIGGMREEDWSEQGDFFFTKLN